MIVVVDTNILIGEGLRSRGMRQLLQVSGAGLLSIAIPVLVRREFIGNAVDSVAEDLVEARSALRSARKASAKSGATTAAIDLLIESIDAKRRSLNDDMESQFSSWLSQNRIQEIPTPSGSADAVLDEYFSGAPPFRSARSKADFLDAIILRAIGEFASRNDRVVFVTSDARLGGEARARLGVDVFDTLSALVSSDAFVTLMDQAGLAEDPQAVHLLARLRDQESTTALLAMLRESDKFFRSLYFESPDLTAVDRLSVPGFGHTAEVSSSADVLDLSIGPVGHNGDRSFRVAFQADCLARVRYAADYGDFFELAGEDSDTVALVSVSGHGVCDLEEARLVLVSGEIMLDLSVASPEELPSAISERGEQLIEDVVAVHAEIVD